jgi:uncharacterized membrane protein YdjX (TVP38/TMEM64 family)
MEQPVTEEIAPPSGSLRNRLILLGLFALVVAGFYLSGAYDYFSWDSLKAHRDAWRGWVNDHFVEAAVLFLLASVIVMSVSLPVGSIVSLAGGALFDLWWGVALVTIASNVGACIAFLSSRYLFREFVKRWFGRWWAKVDRGIERDGWVYLLMLRLSPVVPFFAVNPTMGLTGMRLGTFFWISLIGMLPGSFLYVMAGTMLTKLESPKDILSTELVVIISLLAFLPLVMKWIFRKRTAA